MVVVALASKCVRVECPIQHLANPIVDLIILHQLVHVVGLDIGGERVGWWSEVGGME